ncbi:GGDEF domain-containing protein [Pseudomonas sp. KNUC1026]|uniref:GGDEF domain-containing protein n=1 Tax=Pseudomonas sp. KNUC1026 TaxID=2893890 RepID=UPI001F2B4E9E|nr:sensor domain-containing diguanylate cyclase [Pseudomonas sp. KNUC1026]UFH48738.1 sensor domain-containing diguanylate cyclase [Pseudomonas sp. KNUC1026]
MPTTLTSHNARAQRLLATGCLAGIAAIIALVTFLLAREHSLARATAVRNSANIAQLIDADVQRNVELYDLALQGLAETVSHPDFARIPPRLRHQMLFGRAIAAPLRGDVLWLDTEGNVVADSLTTPPRAGNFSAWADFQYLRDHPGNALHISPPFRDTLGDLGWCISFSRRIETADGRFLGVATGALRLDYFNHLFRDLNIGVDSSISLISDTGYILARETLGSGEDVAGQNFAHSPGMRPFLEGGRSGSLTQISGLDGKERVYTYTQVGKLPLKVVVGISTEQVFGPWRRTAGMVGFATVALCLGIFMLTLLLRRELNRRQRAELNLANLAMTDGLTGLANRRRLDQALELEWLRAQRNRDTLAVLMIDVDHFKVFNERHGHHGGDSALRGVAQIIGDCIHRPADLAARYGGEEFVVVLAQTELYGALVLAETIRKAVQMHPPMGAGLSRVTVSIGVSALRARPGVPLDALLCSADQALYQAKAEGRNRVCSLEGGLAQGPEQKTPAEPAQ